LQFSQLHRFKKALLVARIQEVGKMLVSLQIATAAIGTAAVSNSIEHTKAAVRITIA
jgi:hypothetical protein